MAKQQLGTPPTDTNDGVAKGYVDTAVAAVGGSGGAKILKLAQSATVPGGTASGTLVVRDGYGYVAVGAAQPTAPGEFVWFKTDGNGNFVDLLIGKN